MRPSEQFSPYSLTWVKIAHPGVKTCNFWQDESFRKEHWYEGGWFGTAIKPHPSSTLSWNHPDTFQVIFPSGLWRLHIMSNPQNNTQLRERLQNRTGVAKHELKPWTKGPRIQEFGINRTQRNFSKNSRVIERIAHPSNPSEIWQAIKGEQNKQSPSIERCRNRFRLKEQYDQMKQTQDFIEIDKISIAKKYCTRAILRRKQLPLPLWELQSEKRYHQRQGTNERRPSQQGNTEQPRRPGLHLKDCTSRIALHRLHKFFFLQKKKTKKKQKKKIFL